MSKALFKKELEKMSASQLRHLILETYEARKEFKEYFEFFLNPDAGKLRGKYENLILKEFQRYKRGYSKVRITKVRRYVKDFESFQPGWDMVLILRINTILQMDRAALLMYHTDAQLNSYVKFIMETLLMADRNQQADKVLKLLDALFAQDKNNKSYFYRLIREALEDFQPAPELK